VPISSLGVGSGLQAEQIIASLMAVERRPLQALQNQEKDIKTKVSSFGQLQSLFSDLQTSSRDLGSLMLWKQTKATCSDPAAIAVASSNGAAPGTYNVGVTNLAEAQTISSRAYSDSNAQLSAGKLTIELGQWTGEPVSGFEPKPGSGPISITIGNNDSSLAKVRDKINNANAGVTASIVRDANGARLSIVAKDTGASNAFKVSVVEDIDDGDASTGLSGLAFDRTSSDSPMTLNQAARNAVATINGISISSASNTLENVAEGLTLSLLSKSASSVAISVAQDTDAVKAGIESFVKSFNAIASYFKSQTKYDAGSKNAARRPYGNYAAGTPARRSQRSKLGITEVRALERRRLGHEARRNAGDEIVQAGRRPVGCPSRGTSQDADGRDRPGLQQWLHGALSETGRHRDRI
jgi:flagellar hook-associated protein 2